MFACNTEYLGTPTFKPYSHSSTPSHSPPKRPKRDNALKLLVRQNGPKDWTVISKHFADRCGKQCRQRWHNHLRDGVCKDEWTLQEEWLLTLAVEAYGRKWSTISKILKGRTDNTIKNHWNCKMKSRKGEFIERIHKLLNLADFSSLVNSKIERELLELIRINSSFTAPYNPQESLQNLQMRFRRVLIEFYETKRESEVTEYSPKE